MTERERERKRERGRERERAELLPISFSRALIFARMRLPIRRAMASGKASLASNGQTQSRRRAGRSREKQGEAGRSREKQGEAGRSREKQGEAGRSREKQGEAGRSRDVTLQHEEALCMCDCWNLWRRARPIFC